MSQKNSTITAKSPLRKLVELRERVKKKKPKFRTAESWRYKRVKENWRRPRGIDNKMRQKKRGWPKSVSVGYRGPKNARGLHPSGYQEVLVTNVDDLLNVNPELQAIRIAHTVGAKKRFEILAKAKEKGIRILNPGEIKKPEEEEEAEAVAAEEEKGEEAEKTETEAEGEKES
jgi:large subunit ribosomal protein L32e